MGWRGPSRQRGGLPLPSPASLRHVGSRSPTKDPGSWPRARKWPLPMQPSRLCSASPGVAEAILEAGRVWVRPGRLFPWEDVEDSLHWALQST